VRPADAPGRLGPRNVAHRQSAQRQATNSQKSPAATIGSQNRPCRRLNGWGQNGRGLSRFFSGPAFDGWAQAGCEKGGTHGGWATPVISIFVNLCQTFIAVAVRRVRIRNAPLVAGVGILLWWMFASRARSRERWLGPLAVACVAVASYFVLDASIQGMSYAFFVVPTGVAAFGLALVCFAWASPSVRTCAVFIAALVGFGGWAFMRNDGIWGDFKTSLHGRWEPTAEDRFLADLKKSDTLAVPATSQAIAGELGAPEWPEFRGPKRDGSVPGIAIDPDWKAHPPKEVWRRQVGPGWSSFSVAGHSIFTQEQRGDVEVVACYDADTGGQRWIRESPARVWESVAGARPRATPTLSGGMLFAAGATG
jgi:hypothetical protein